MTTITQVPRRRSFAAVTWPLSYAALAILAFLFYRYWVENLGNSGQQFVHNWIPLQTMSLCVIYAIMAIGLNIVVGYAGLLDLGYVAFWAIGTYVGAWTMSTFFYQVKFHLGDPTIINKAVGVHISFWLVLVIAGAFTALWGLIIGGPTLRLRSDYLALVTLGFGEIIPQVITNGDKEHLGFNLTNGTKNIGPVDAIGTGAFSNLKGVNATLGYSAEDLAVKFLVFCLIAAFCVFVSLRIRHGRLGRAWLAIREDELAANMMGVTVVKAKLSAYAVGAVFGGMGGVAYVTFVGSATNNFSFANSIIVLLMVVLGGMGNVWGVILGAVVIEWFNQTGLKQLSDSFNDHAGTHIAFQDWNLLIFGVVLVLMMLFRREGFLPESRTRLIMREPARTELEAVGADIEAAETEVGIGEVAEEAEEELVGSESSPGADGGKS